MAFSFSKSNLPKQLFINNEYIDSKHHKKLTLHNPNDGSLVADDVALAGADDVDAAVSAAEKAFPSWRALAPQARQSILLKFSSLLEKHVDALGDLSRISLGQPKWVTKYEICRGADTFKYYAGWVDKFAGESYPQEDGFMKIVRNEPLGVTVGIVPWNGPISSLSLKAAAALATGNCHIIKPSEKTPFSTAALGPLIIEAGFPPGVFQILTGDGSTGALLAAHMRVRKVSFTGSIPTGKRVQEAAAKSNLKRVTLELGGKSPAVIFDDCNLQNAIEWTTRSITLNTGQACFAASRVYVHEDLAEKFIEAYKAKFKEITAAIGDPDEESTMIGPLVDEIQFKRVSGYIERGRNGQGTMIIGGKRVGDKGYYIEPTIFKNVSHDAEILREEIFGPVAIVNTFKSESEVIELSNNSEHGLMAGVFTQDINRALRVASAFDSGMVGINCVSHMFLNAPFGGTKQSGIGRESGRESLLQYTDRKTIMVNLTY